MSQTIFRGHLSRDFTTIPNALLRDSRLSFKARGLLAMVLSNRDDWVIHKGWLEKQTTEGREAISSAIKELEEQHYVIPRNEASQGGKFARKVWHFYDEPVTVDGKPLTANRVRQTVDGFPSAKKEQEGKTIKETPCSPPEGDGAGKRVSSIKSKKPSSPEAKALAALFKRSEDRIWSDGEIRAYRKMKPTLDDIALISTYYAFERNKGGDGIHRKDLKTFLNNYPGELDRANAWKADPKANEKTRNASGAHQRGHSSRNAGTFNEGKGAEYKGLQRTT